MVLLKPMGFALTSKVTAFCSVSLFSVHSAALCPDYYALPGRLEADISDDSPGAKSKTVVLCGMFPSLPFPITHIIES